MTIIHILVFTKLGRFTLRIQALFCVSVYVLVFVYVLVLVLVYVHVFKSCSMTTDVTS